MKLSEQLMKICEEKAKIECENQKLIENCVEWQKACELRNKCINDLLEDKKKIAAERQQDMMENIELRAYVNAAKRIFDKCGKYIYTYRNEFSISNYDLESLELHCFGVKECEEQPAKEISYDDDILDLFKQSLK